MKYGLLLVCVLFFCDISSGQRKQQIAGKRLSVGKERADLVFDNLTEKDGLCHNQVTSMLTDKHGYLWIGTNSGLNRYNGKTFDVFKKNRKDPNSLLNNTIVDLTCDEQGNLYGLTPSGIFQFNYSSSDFHNHYWNKNNYIQNFQNLLVMKNQEVYVSTGDNGLVKVRLSGGKPTSFMQDSSRIHSISSTKINEMLMSPDRKGLWLTTLQGLNYLDLATGEFKNHQNTSDQAIFNDHNVSSLSLSPAGHLWLMDNDTKHIIGFDPKSHAIKHRIDVAPMMKIPYAGNLFESTSHELYYSSISYEIIKIKYLQGNAFEALKNDPSNPSSISGDFIMAAWEDRDRTVWLGTIAGISRVNEERNFYRVVPLGKKFPELENNNWQITCLAQNPYTKTWWVGTRDGRIYEYDNFTGASSVIDVKKMTDNRNTSFYITDLEFIDNKAIVCMSYGYPVELDLKTGKARIVYKVRENLGRFKPAVITQETDSTFLMGNNQLPILRWFPKTNRTEEVTYPDSFLQKNQKLPAKWLKSRKNTGSWISSDQFLGHIPIGSTTIVPYKVYRAYDQDPESDAQAISGGFIHAMEIDSLGNTWFAQLGQGLYQLNKTTGRLSMWDSSDGLVSEILNSSFPDKSGRIWAASYNKFSIFDPASNQFFNFKIELSNQNPFYYNYIMSLDNDHIVTNIMGNLIEIFPDRIVRQYPKNEPVISSIVLPSGKKLLWGEEKLVLNPDDNFITLHFGSLSDARTYEYHFKYKIEGINNDWVKAGDDATAVYTNLAPGNYTFEMQAISNDGYWKSDIKKLKLKIKAPFYKSGWFLLLCLLTLLSVVSWVVLSRLNHLHNINALRSKAQLLEKEKTAVMYENLKQHLNPHFLFNSLTSLSSLIRLDQKKAADFLDKMSKVYRYILKNKENEVVPLSEEIKFVELYNQLQQTRFGEGLSIKIDIPEEKRQLNIAPVTLQNLVENAIKHNIADEDDPLQIDIFVEGTYLIVKNSLKKKNYVETSNKQGLQSMISLYRFLSPLPMIVEAGDAHFTVKIPLI
ncbi:MAG: histidine kinase [Saprospiraceae bacterium]|nr:histidine kinase [Saprospiraceae bacterium]